MLDLFLSWLVSALIESDSSMMQTTIHSSICMHCRWFYCTSWSKRRHPISSIRCIDTIINCSITTLLGKLIQLQTSTRHFILAYRHEPVLKQGIDVLTGKSSFVEGWSLLGTHFPNLLDYCASVVTLFTRTSAIEFDFFVLCWEKYEFCKALFNFGLERILQMKQYLFIEQLFESN